MSTQRYQLPDEPRPGALAQTAVDPMWPMFAFILVGAWMGLAWFALNTFALGSPTWRRELGLVALALGGSALLFFGLAGAFESGWLDQQTLRYAMLGIVALKLGCAYGLHVMQSRVFELFTYFGGEAKNGMVVLILGMVMLRAPVGKALSGSVFGVILQ
ncbi:MAG TPA: hypothetical protein VM555_00770 [Tahibacter sp.]|nr:hypothetical protein [Tahibacter sp.]